MKKIGVVSCYYNYGSLLQAYALKEFFEQNNCICELFDCKKVSYYRNNSFKSRLLKLSNLLKIFMRSKDSAPYIFNYNFLINKNNFLKVKLHPNFYDKKLLVRLAHNDAFDYFFAGSDQIWRAGIGKVKPIFLLDFAPNNKRCAISPSIGCTTIKNKNLPLLSRELPKFKHLSIREEAGRDAIKKLFNLDAKVLSDPVTLFDKDFWDKFSKDGKKVPTNYIFVHLLNRVDNKYIKLIYDLAKRKNLEIISFYNDANKKQLNKEITNIEGTPEDMLSLLKNADYVFTDSFHTSQFSIIFNRNFYIIPRAYGKNSNQHSRIDELTNKFSCQERVIPVDTKIETLLKTSPFYDDKKFKYWSNLTRKYILDIINSPQDKPNNVSTNINVCINCKLCEAICPKKAISFKPNHFLYDVPIIDTNKCTNCGLCLQKCNEAIKKHDPIKHTGYIAYNTDNKLRKMSASGGMFSAIATEFIKDGGIVFGAKLIIDSDKTTVQLTEAKTLDEILPLLNSKYVECEVYPAFSRIKALLDSNKKVLVSNTSCKIAALYKYLGKNYDNLYTIDLICHGTPGIPLFAKYVCDIENEANGKITKFAFRRKSYFGNYAEIAEIASQNRLIKYHRPAFKSVYYSMFLKGHSYRDCCYNCKYSSVDKPADITIGDYYEAPTDYPKIAKRKMVVSGLSSLITHNQHGEELINKYGKLINKKLVDYKIIQLSHTQLCMPGKYSSKRFAFFNKTNLFE